MQISDTHMRQPVTSKEPHSILNWLAKYVREHVGKFLDSVSFIFSPVT